VVLALLLGVLAPAARAQDQPTASKRDSVVDLINSARLQAGVMPVARSSELDASAQAHSLDMVQNNYLDHTGSDGSTPQQRADLAGYHVPANSGWIVVEVVSAISADPAGPVNWWLGDDQHRNVLLNPRFREIGVGYAEGGEYGNYWTADFGCRPGVVPSVSVDGVTYQTKEECGDPSTAGALVATPTPTPQPNPTATVPVPTPVPSAHISVAQGSGPITVMWANIGQPSATDWFGIYKPDTVDTVFEDWEYVSCTKVPDRPRPSGSCSVQIPAGIGAYEVRLFSSNGYTPVARSGVEEQTTLNVSPEISGRGAEVNVRWRGVASPANTDWFGLFRRDDGDAQPLIWQYVGCASTPLDARALGACNVLLPTSIAPGIYEFRLFAADGYQRLAVSPPIQLE